MTDAPSVREAAWQLLPWAVLIPIAGVACFQLDGIFIGAAWTADMRNMMIVCLAIFLAAYTLLTPAFGNHGLWASLIVFYAAWAATLPMRYPVLVKASFGKKAQPAPLLTAYEARAGIGGLALSQSVAACLRRKGKGASWNGAALSQCPVKMTL